MIKHDETENFHFQNPFVYKPFHVFRIVKERHRCIHNVLIVVSFFVYNSHRVLGKGQISQ